MVTDIKKDKANNSDALLDTSTNKWFSYTSTSETTRSWPKIITSFDEVPSFFKDHIYIESKKFPYSILIPENIEYVLFMAKKTEPKLLSLYNDRIIILEKKNNEIKKQSHIFNEINYVKIKNILLYSSIKFVSSNNVSHIFFNSVRFNFFKTIIETMRKYYVKTDNDESIESKNEERIIEYHLSGKINYKFMNYSIDSLLPGQSVKNMLSQEPVKIKRFKNRFFKWIYNYTTPILLILTDSELIILEEPYKIRKNKDIEYGIIFTYLPLNKIKKVVFENDNYKTMNIKLNNDETIKLYFSEDKEVENFLIL